MRRLGWLVMVGAAALAAQGCTEKDPDYCADASAYKYSCALADAAAHDMKVEKTDAGDASDATDAGDVADATDAGDAGDAGDAMDLAPEKPMCSLMSCTDDKASICEVDAGTCRGCMNAAECKARFTGKPACDQGQCYECAAGADCTTATKPICESHACRKCKADTECGAPGICLEDGSCATAGQVVFVEFDAAGCAGADGTTAKPYCTPNEGAAVLTANRPLLVIRGPANNQLVLDTTLAAITVIGRKNGAGEAASIPAVASTAVRVASGDVLMRDLAVTGGTGTSSRGVTVSGGATKLRLLRMKISTGMGLGVQADTSAALTMDRCTVDGNAAGGLLVNGASYQVTNSVFAGNGYGVKFNVPKTPSAFVANTVVMNTGNAVTCDPSSAQKLVASIIVGVNDSCDLVSTVTTLPTFDAARPYHLTAHLACPAPAVAMPPDHDLDGDPRGATLDCGADQLVP